MSSVQFGLLLRVESIAAVATSFGISRLIDRTSHGGVIAESFGPEWVYVTSAAVIGSLLLFGRPLFRRVDETVGAGPTT